MIVMANMPPPKSDDARFTVDPSACNDLVSGMSEGNLCGVMVHHIFKTTESLA